MPAPQPGPENSTSTPVLKRPVYAPGQLVVYTVQSGDTLAALAAHFNTSIAEIRMANPQISMDVTTLPPGLPMKMPVFYSAPSGTPLQILPDS